MRTHLFIACFFGVCLLRLRCVHGRDKLFNCALPGAECVLELADGPVLGLQRCLPVGAGFLRACLRKGNKCWQAECVTVRLKWLFEKHCLLVRPHRELDMLLT